MIVRRSRFLSVPLLALGVFLASCTSEDDADVATSDVALSTTLQALPDSTLPDLPETTAVDPVARISVTVGIDSSPDRVEEVALGQDVALTLMNPDADDEFHLHGYDLGGGVTTKGETKTFTFTATEAGEFELESHVTGDVLVVVKVS